MYISLYSIIQDICGVSCGYININTYEIHIDYNDDEKYHNSSFISLPFIDATSYRDLQNTFLKKYFPKRFKEFANINGEEFEDYFHITINDNLLLYDWYKYEDDYKIKLLQEWCEQNNIKYSLKRER